MKKTLLICMGLILLLPSISGATIIKGDPGTDVVEMAAGSYSLPEGYSVIADSPGTIDHVGLDHDSYYYWNIRDLSSIPDAPAGESYTLDVVFHDVYDWAEEEDSLDVFIIDGAFGAGLSPVVDWLGVEQDGWFQGTDGSSGAGPAWPGWTYMGTWTDDAGGWGGSGGTYDVLFQITLDAEWIAYLTDGDGFTIGIDPDCHYYFDDITVAAPVPEPATMLLFGVGLVALAGVGRKKFMK